MVLPDSLGSDADVAPTDTMPQAQTYRGYRYGRVVYTHGPGIDAPLALIRMDYSDALSTPQLVVLHNDWRGEYDIGSYAGGTLAKPCVRITRSSNFKTVTSDGTISDYPKAPGPLNTSWYHCVEVEWPAPHVWVTRETRNRSINGPLAWMGTLIDGMRDNSGQMYMRNRYYDPASGRFTQEEPIGLAGGLNAYGFAEGDPVTYADPFGLKSCKDRVQALRRRVSRIRNRIREYLDAVPRGLNDGVHKGIIDQEIQGFNEDLDAYHSADNGEKCSDDDDDFRGVRNAGVSLIRMHLPVPAREGNPHPPPPGYRGRTDGLMTVRPDAVSVATGRNIERAGWVGLAGTVLIVAGAALLSPIGL